MEHTGSKTTQPGSKAELPSCWPHYTPYLWLCQSPTNKWVETGPTKMPHTTHQSLGKRLKAGSVSIMRWGEPHRGLLSHIFSQQHPTWKFSAHSTCLCQHGVCVWGGGCTILFQTQANSPGSCFHEYLVNTGTPAESPSAKPHLFSSAFPTNSLHPIFLSTEELYNLHPVYTTKLPMEG